MNARQGWLWLALLVALAATTLFGARSARRAVEWRRHADERVRPWMSLGYIAHSYHLPPQSLHRALGLSPGDRRPLVVIARVRHQDVNHLIAQVRLAILQTRKTP